MDIKQIVGKNIQKYRKLKHLTQEKLAEMIDIETISLSKIETGKNYPTAENLTKISAILHIAPNEFFIPQSDATNEEIINNIHKRIELVKKDKKKLRIIEKIINAVL